MNLLKPATGAGLLIAACAACCAPLIAPWIVALIVAGGGAGLALAGQVGLAVLIAGAGGLYIWSSRRKQRLAASAAPGCGCGTETRCSSGATSSRPLTSCNP